MAAVSVAGVAMGLLLSAVVTNADRAASIVPIVLIPQVIFSGTLDLLPRPADRGQAPRMADGGPLGRAGGRWRVGGRARSGTRSSTSRMPGNAPAKLWQTPFWVGVWPSVFALAVIALAVIVGTVWALQRKDIKRQLAKMRR